MIAFAAGTALSVGFGAARQFLGSRLLANGDDYPVHERRGLGGNDHRECLFRNPVVGDGPVLGGYVCASLTFVGEDLGWIAMQAVIALLIGTSYASTVKDGLVRSSFILFGGLVQILCISVVWRMAGIGHFGSESKAAKVSAERGPALNQMGRLF